MGDPQRAETDATEESEDAAATKTTLATEAENALSRGWVLTPVRGKIPKLRAWQSRSADETDSVEQWVEQGFNLAVRTGEVSGVIVIDDDTEDGSGVAQLDLPVTVTAITGGGGRHYYFRAPDFKVKNTVGSLAEKVDVRGDGGCAVLPGSTHPDSGSAYSWLAERSPDDVEVAELPRSMRQRLAPDAGKRQQDRKGRDAIEGAPWQRAKRSPVPADSGSPFDRIVSRLDDVSPTAKGVKARCPAHEDKDPSLDVDRGRDGTVLLCCRSAKCPAEQIVAAVGLEMSDLFPESRRPDTKPATGRSPRKRHPTKQDAAKAAHWSVTKGSFDGTLTIYDYQEESGETVGCIFRFDFSDGRRKQIRRARREDNYWINQDMPAPKPLYRLPEVSQSGPEIPVLIVEGEKCADRLAALGVLATTTCGGAHAPLQDSNLAPLKGRRVVILPDSGDAGRSYGENVASAAHVAGAASVAILELEGLSNGEDVVDWLAHKHAQGVTDDDATTELIDLAQAAPEAGIAANEDPIRKDDPDDQGPGLVSLGARDPETGKVVLSPTRTLPTAEAFVQEFYSHREGHTLVHYSGLFFRWCRNRYTELEEGHLNKQLFRWLDDALRYVKDGNGNLILANFESNPGTVLGALRSVQAILHSAATTPVPSWLDGEEEEMPADEILACASSDLHIPSGKTRNPTPRLFNFSALDFDYDPRARTPERWIAFLQELFAGQEDSVSLLQEWTGYCLTADTRQQKMLLMVGPRRSGKGTIARVLRGLVGETNVVGPTVGSLAGNFGLQPLIGKPVAVVSDARFKGEHVATVVERLLCISGEDAISIDRKFLPAVTMKLPTRFVFLSNELPKFNDSSTALAGRFLILPLAKSFFGKEDVGLTKDLQAELPGILLWALQGWRRLRDRGHFLEPEVSRSATQDLESLSSPIGEFIREHCDVGAGLRVPVDDIFAYWNSWRESEGHGPATSKATFGRDLRAAMPAISKKRGTDMQSFYEGVQLRNEVQR